ncbi:hypothetical protein [Ligilactobacillus salivarius]|uniref:hypothetical protein n=1 Tax=Ligilactobacillus salivarius TaxID=1624 RepID=UPI00267185A6|nr:hypothetical protein [Ligilactobacillus salivarius]
MELLHSEKRILKKLIKLSNGEIKEFIVDELPFKFNNYFLQTLADKKLVRIYGLLITFETPEDLKNSDIRKRVVLTDEGINYFKKHHQESINELKSFLIKSFFIPIIVSTFTTLFTMWIKSFF